MSNISDERREESYLRKVTTGHRYIVRTFFLFLSFFLLMLFFYIRHDDEQPCDRTGREWEPEESRAKGPNDETMFRHLA